MGDPNAGLPPRYLRTAEAARFLSLSGRTLEKHRTYGTGPAYRKIGGRFKAARTRSLCGEGAALTDVREQFLSTGAPSL